MISQTTVNKEEPGGGEVECTVLLYVAAWSGMGVGRRPEKKKVSERR